MGKRKRVLAAVIAVGSMGAMATAGLLMISSPIHQFKPRAQEISAEPLTLEEPYQAFEKNFAALLEARRVQVVGMPDGGSAPSTQAELVKNWKPATCNCVQ